MPFLCRHISHIFNLKDDAIGVYGFQCSLNITVTSYRYMHVASEQCRVPAFLPVDAIAEQTSIVLINNRISFTIKL